MTKKRSRILGVAMLVIAAIFFIVALTHPETSFTLDISLTYLLYGAYFIKEIAEAEGFTTSAAFVTVRNAIIKLQKYYIKRGWMKPPKEKAICTKTAPPKRNRKKTSAKKS